MLGKKTVENNVMSLRAVIALAVVGLCLLCASISASAQDAYTVEVAVADRSPAEQDAAYRIAMQRVLLDNAADKTLLNRTDVRTALASAKTYVVQFNYRRPDTDEVIPATMPVTDLVRNTGEATQIMKVRFDRESITSVIKGVPQSADNNAPAPVNFRNALVWMLIRDNGRDLLIGGGAGANVMQRSREIAGGNGIVLSFPAADEIDIQALGGDAIGLSQEAVLSASVRYTAPVVVSADISRRRPVGWQGQWQRIANNQVETESFEASSLDELLNLGLTWMAPGQSSNVVASTLAAPAAPLASESTIWFSGVRTTADYAQLMQLVNGIDSLQSVYAKELRDQGVMIAVQPRSALSQVRTRLAQVASLRETARPVFSDGSSPAVDAAFDFAR